MLTVGSLRARINQSSINSPDRSIVVFTKPSSIVVKTRTALLLLYLEQSSTSNQRNIQWYCTVVRREALIGAITTGPQHHHKNPQYLPLLEYLYSCWQNRYRIRRRPKPAQRQSPHQQQHPTTTAKSNITVVSQRKSRRRNTPTTTTESTTTTMCRCRFDT